MHSHAVAHGWTPDFVAAAPPTTHHVAPDVLPQHGRRREGQAVGPLGNLPERLGWHQLRLLLLL
eukprot:1747569-Pyramimonas_sp.AAC.1